MKEQQDKEILLFYFAIAFFIASIIRTEFIPVFAIFIGFNLGRLKNIETWVKIK